MRICTVNGSPALFHRWVEISQVVPPSPMIMGAPGGEVKNTFAIVEREEGTVLMVHPTAVVFEDTAKVMKKVMKQTKEGA